MTRVRDIKLSLGIFAGLIAGILMALLWTPMPAHAATTNVGGLVFEYDDAAGVTETQISESGGIITIIGSTDFTVSQVEVGQGPIAVGLKLGNGTNTNYSGTITLTNVNLLASTAGPAIQFANIAPSATAGSSCMVVLGSGVTLSTPSTGSLGSTSEIVKMDSAADDALVLQDGASIAANPSNSLVAVTVGGTAGNKSITFAGEGTISGGNSSGTNGAINVTCQTTASLIIDGDGTGTIAGVSDGTPAPGITLAPTNLTTPANPVLTFANTGELNVYGGNGINTGAAAPGADGIYVVSGSTNNSTTEVSGTGMLTVQGGNGSDVTTSGQAGGQGGDGFNLGTAPSGAAVTVTLNVYSDITITGGFGGASYDDTAGAGGNGINIYSAASNDESHVNFYSGTATIAGGDAGTKTNTANGGYALNNTDNKAVINISNGTGTDGDGPTITLIGGSNQAKTNMQDVISGFGTTAGDNIAITANRPGSTKFYPYIAMARTYDTSANEMASPAVLEGFAGMYEGSSTAAENLALAANNFVWAQITPAPLEAVNVGVLNNSTGKEAPYVVAQTDASMNGAIPNSSYVYRPSITGVFTGIEDLDGSNFGTLANITATTIGAAIEPNEAISTQNVAAGTFYVVPDATATTLDLTPEGTTILPKSITNLYPELTAVGAGEVPVVYTVTFTGGGATGTGIPMYLYTNTEGMLSSANGSANTSWTPSIVKAVETQLPIPAWAVPTGAPSGTVFLGWYDIDEDTPEQVAYDDLGIWVGNHTLAALWGTVNIQSVSPSPTSVARGDQVDLTATYQVTPWTGANSVKATSYSLDTAGRTSDVSGVGWSGVFVNTGTGATVPNGMNISQTGGSTAEGAGPWTVTSVATVSANADADLGNYRFAPAYMNFTVSNALAQNPPTCKYAIVNVTMADGTGGITVVRLYNPWTLEHLYTIDPLEVATLDNNGWDNEGVAWTAPVESNLPIYRLYNPNNGDHMYTTSRNEYDQLQTYGWRGEGQKLWSAPNDDGADIYRLYNPYMTDNEGAFAHLWTADFNEYVTLGNQGWKQEGVAFWALAVPAPTD